jgi:transposase-like protein
VEDARFLVETATLAGAVIGSGKWFCQGESRMKKRYQIDKQRATQQFRDKAGASEEQLQLALPLPEVLQLMQQGLMNLALAAFTKLAEGLMRWEVDQVAGPKNQASKERDKLRWGSQRGYCVVAGQKVPLERPRVRDVRQREVALGSYNMLQGASLMEDSVWHKIMHGLTTRRYSEVVRELEQAYGIEKSTVSEYFIEASRGRLQKLQSRPLGEQVFCAMMIDGTYFRDQQVVVAIGLTLQGHKVVLGLHQGATENAIVVRHLLDDIAQRGVAFDVPRLYVLDGGKGLHAAVRKIAGKCAIIQRCQVHKIRNVVGHLTEEYQSPVRCKMRNAYAMQNYADAKRALDALLRELMDLNPSAARSLEEGMEETLSVHRLRVPEKLRATLRTTNPIESAFDTVETVCRKVKRWKGGDQYLRWVASGLLWAESRWNRIHGHREIPILVKELELTVVKAIPVRHASVA